MAENASGIVDELDPVWKSLADPTRRAILDYLRERSRTTTEIVNAFPHLTRFGVMKHLEVLRHAHLVNTREQGRQRVNSLNVVPIRRIYERWVGPFQELWTNELLRIKNLAEIPDVLPNRTAAAKMMKRSRRRGRPTNRYR